MSQDHPVTWAPVDGDPGGNSAVLERIDSNLAQVAEDVGLLRREQLITNARLMALFEALAR